MDIALAWNSAIGSADICVDGPDLAGSDDLATAVLVSLFSDARALPDALPPGDSDRRGWWGDELEDDRDGIGSLLWVAARRKQTPEVLAEMETSALDALAWLVEDRVATGVAALAERDGRERARLRVVVSLPDRTSREFQFADGRII